MLENWPVSAVEEHCQSVENRCEYCDKEEEEHANGQCLFQSTPMKIVPKLHREVRANLDKLEKYCAEVEASLKNVADDLREVFEHIIEDQYFELCPPEKKECEKPGQLTFWTLLPSAQLELPVIGNQSERRVRR